MADRTRLDEAIEVIRPLADAGDEVAGLWLARWLTRQHDMNVRRLAAELGDDHARLSVERWLSRLREGGAAGNEHARQTLAELARNPDWLQFLAERPN